MIISNAIYAYTAMKLAYFAAVFVNFFSMFYKIFHAYIVILGVEI